ncbi:hypothetical protein [Rodentibacter myodis]|uniref:Glycoside hydrolase family 19 catalytic domain-containing protein n=1 Tax=Rodentibacter myodis TaxID=1907939 RepID=A0A1V3JFM4_9PAST|nr:hypothetical protein [Rodentibacter myodis]OOF55428.1 hypothetical protein BKL49_11680 [Rodentibacter myodis]
MGGRLGNNTTGDGFLYRGRGYIQLTGKNNYKLFTEKHNLFYPDDIKDFVKEPDLVSDNIDYCAESACLYWRYIGARYPDTNNLADMGASEDVLIKVSANINGWYGRGDFPNKAKGYEDRRKRFISISKLLGLI